MINGLAVAGKYNFPNWCAKYYCLSIRDFFQNEYKVFPIMAEKLNKPVLTFLQAQGRAGTLP